MSKSSSASAIHVFTTAHRSGLHWAGSWEVSTVSPGTVQPLVPDYAQFCLTNEGSNVTDTNQASRLLVLALALALQRTVLDLIIVEKLRDPPSRQPTICLGKGESNQTSTSYSNEWGIPVPRDRIGSEGCTHCDCTYTNCYRPVLILPYHYS